MLMVYCLIKLDVYYLNLCYWFLLIYWMSYFILLILVFLVWGLGWLGCGEILVSFFWFWDFFWGGWRYIVVEYY